MPIVIEQMEPRVGLTSGGEIVTLRGELPARAGVWFGTEPAPVERVERVDAGSVAMVQVRTPRLWPALVDVTVVELDEHDRPVSGELAVLPASFRFVRAPLAAESDLTRLVRTLLRELRRQVLDNTSVSVSVDYPEDLDAVLAEVAKAQLPSLVLSGPRLRENRTYATNDPGEEVVYGLLGPELRRRRPARTMDLEFGVTLASNRAAELLNLQASLVRFAHANAWLSMPRDQAAPAGPLVGWELDPVGELRPLGDAGGQTDLRAVTWGLVVRGVDLAEDQVLDVGRQVGAAAEVTAGPRADAP